MSNQITAVPPAADLANRLPVERRALVAFFDEAQTLMTVIDFPQASSPCRSRDIAVPEGLPATLKSPAPFGVVFADGSYAICYLAEPTDGLGRAVVTLALDNGLNTVITFVSEKRGDAADDEFAQDAGYVPLPMAPLPGSAVYMDYDADVERFVVGDTRILVKLPGLLHIGAGPDLVARIQPDGTFLIAYLSDGYSGLDASNLVCATVAADGTALDYTETGGVGYVKASNALDALGGPEQANAPVPDSMAWL